LFKPKKRLNINMQNIDLPLYVCDGETYIDFPVKFQEERFARYWSPYGDWLDATVTEAKEELDKVLLNTNTEDPEIQELLVFLRELREELSQETNEENICTIDWQQLAGG
jgi:hypothetical protein